MKRILDIGGGATPYFIRYKIPWDSSNELIVADLDEENIRAAKETLGRFADEQGNIIHTFLLSDATKLDFPEEYVDEVVLSNTLSAPIHHDWDRDGTKLSKKNKSMTLERVIKSPDSFGDPFYIERKKLLAEALRVLKKGGKLSIYTDLIIYGQESYQKLLIELKTDPFLHYQYDPLEARRIDILNIQKLATNEFCCCFRAEVLPQSEVFRFIKL